MYPRYQCHCTAASCTKTTQYCREEGKEKRALYLGYTFLFSIHKGGWLGTHESKCFGVTCKPERPEKQILKNVSGNFTNITLIVMEVVVDLILLLGIFGWGFAG